MAKEKRKIIYEKGDRYNLYFSEYITDEAIEWLNRQENLNRAILQAINQVAIQDKQNSSLDSKPHNPLAENIDNSNIVKLLANLVQNVEVINNNSMQNQNSKLMQQNENTEVNNIPANEINRNQEMLSEKKLKDISITKENKKNQQDKSIVVDNNEFSLRDKDFINTDNKIESNDHSMRSNENNISNNIDTKEKVLSNTSNTNKTKIRRKRLNNYNGKLTKGI